MSNRPTLIGKLCENLVDRADLDTLCDFYFEEQFRYFDKEADLPELLDWLVSTEIITQEEANEIEKNGF